MRKKKTKRKQKNKKIIPLNLKSLGNEIEAYPFVAIEWSDIEGDAGWSSTKDLNKEKLPFKTSPVSRTNLNQ